jgi:hypothetical protein
MYSMSHNATGYSEDMNPDLIDGIHDPRDTWAARNAKLALRAEAIVRSLDPTRIVYHHASGNLGAMHDSNFYPNFAPIQELSDWFEHWSTAGVKPLFTCEYGAPFTWDWTMYRGWYKGVREFGSAKVPWEFCLAEWNAQFLGDAAFNISESEKANLRWEAAQFKAGQVWHRWDYPVEVGSNRLEERYPVFARYLTDNWRAFRTWGVSAISPWEYGHFWRLRDGVDKRRRNVSVDWENLQRPGFSPDYLGERCERMDLAYERSDWLPTAAALALLRNNRPLLAYLAGKPGQFTSKDHIFLPGEVVQKQLILLNNLRQTVQAECHWSLQLPQSLNGSRMLSLSTGQQEGVPLRFELPNTLTPGRYELTASVRFSSGEVQEDDFWVDVVAPPTAPEVSPRMALFDPKGETRALFQQLGLQAQPVLANTDLAPFDLLVIGRSALTLDGTAPDFTRVRDGLKVIVFEQPAEVLEKRLGFHVVEYGLRQVFPRVAEHPVIAGLTLDDLRDWRGSATTVPPRLNYEMRPRYGPTIQWCGIPVTQVWRCGNRGNVASVLIEKPALGDFLPILDGGYSLQYSPLLEFHEGKGLILFCQLDVTQRSDNEPTADSITRKLVRYASRWRPAPSRKVVYAGGSDGMQFLQAAGVSAVTYRGEGLAPDELLVLAPGERPSPSKPDSGFADWLRQGGHVLAIGLGQEEIASWLPQSTQAKRAEHIACFFPAFGTDSPFRGIGPADLHNRDPRIIPLIAGGAQAFGDGVLAQTVQANVVFCQMEPWAFYSATQPNLRRTYRRATFAVSRLLANVGAGGATPLLDRMRTPVSRSKAEKRYFAGLYIDKPEEWDDPYRFFRW